MDPIRQMYDVATEGFLSSIRERIRNRKNLKAKSKPVEKPSDLPSEADRIFNEQYRDKIIALGQEISKHIQSSKVAHYDHMEIAGRDNKFNIDVHRDGTCDLVIWHWQGYDGETDKPVPPAAILEKERKNIENDFADDDTSTMSWAMEKVEKELEAIAAKFASKARAIHPKCTVKLWCEDVDVLFIHFDKSWLNV